MSGTKRRVVSSVFGENFDVTRRVEEARVQESPREVAFLETIETRDRVGYLACCE